VLLVRVIGQDGLLEPFLAGLSIAASKVRHPAGQSINNSM
jgi:hypothetical protein